MDALVVGNLDTKKPVTSWEQAFALAGFVISRHLGAPTKGIRELDIESLLGNDICPGPHYKNATQLPEVTFYKGDAAKESANEFAMAFSRLTGVLIPVKPLIGGVLDIHDHECVVVFDPKERSADDRISFNFRDVHRQAEMKSRWDGDCNSGLIAAGAVTQGFVDLMKEYLPTRWR